MTFLTSLLDKQSLDGWVAGFFLLVILLRHSGSRVELRIGNYSWNN